jgi:hypothetical protein
MGPGGGRAHREHLVVVARSAGTAQVLSVRSAISAQARKRIVIRDTVTESAAAHIDGHRPRRRAGAPNRRTVRRPCSEREARLDCARGERSGARAKDRDIDEALNTCRTALPTLSCFAKPAVIASVPAAPGWRCQLVLAGIRPGFELSPPDVEVCRLVVVHSPTNATKEPLSRLGRRRVTLPWRTRRRVSNVGKSPSGHASSLPPCRDTVVANRVLVVFVDVSVGYRY